MSFNILNPTRHDTYPFIDPSHNLRGAAAGKTVLITGAGAQGIGGAIAQAFARAGASSVVLVGRRKEPLSETRDLIGRVAPGCRVVVADGVDVSDAKQVDKLFGGLEEVPDVVVSNAATTQTELIAESDPEVWWRTLEVNLKGPYLIARAYVNAVRGAAKKKMGGRIINVSSNGSWNCAPGFSAYSASKIALNSFSEYVDTEERAAGSGVRCVAMHPGGVITEMAERTEMAENMRKMLVDQPGLPGGTAVFLSTDQATFLMGRFVSSTCDMEELEKLKERVVEEDLLKSRVVGLKR
ncbi:hypothetical protein LTR62_004382 [Meristemomyces frigidus]|uniref:Ketoreductase domain-containing protein n=1 Tax=Meristemomyces frigidus TaxID=1508187 RepID=A0AAN7TEN8_9PEZI|nr:hypothetical protein LTR62_004382 [Meristemomyces frigidus]